MPVDPDDSKPDDKPDDSSDPDGNKPDDKPDDSSDPDQQLNSNGIRTFPIPVILIFPDLSLMVTNRMIVNRMINRMIINRMIHQTLMIINRMANRMIRQPDAVSDVPADEPEELFFSDT